MTDQPSSKAALIKRLSGYWKLELGNVLMVPACLVFLALTLEYPLGWLTWVSLVPMCGLLLIGGFYWRAKLHQMEGQSASMQRLMRWASPLQVPMGVLSALACALCLYSWSAGAFAVSFGDRVTATIAAVLALLEYVNYYHRQVQHFDHLPDLRRFMQGKGFRPSQMAIDLRRYRDS